MDYWLSPFPEVPRSVEEPESGAMPNQEKVEEESYPNFPPNPPNLPLALAPPPAASYVTRSGHTSGPPAYLANFVN